MMLPEKEEKDGKSTGKVMERAQRKKGVYWIKVIYIIGQRKVLWKQTIPHSTCTKKKTVATEKLIPSTDDDKKIMQPICITSRSPIRMRKWNQFSQFRWTSTKVIPVEKT